MHFKEPWRLFYFFFFFSLLLFCFLCLFVVAVSFTGAFMVDLSATNRTVSVCVCVLGLVLVHPTLKTYTQNLRLCTHKTNMLNLSFCLTGRTTLVISFRLRFVCLKAGEFKTKNTVRAIHKHHLTILYMFFSCFVVVAVVLYLFLIILLCLKAIHSFWVLYTHPGTQNAILFFCSVIGCLFRFFFVCSPGSFFCFFVFFFHSKYSLVVVHWFEN